MTADPLLMRRLNAWLVWFWLLNLPLVVALYLILGPDPFTRFCLLYLALVSIYANAAGHISGWQAANTEAHLRDDIDT